MLKLWPMERYSEYSHLKEEFDQTDEEITRIKREVRNWRVRDEALDIISLELKKAQILRKLAQRTRSFDVMEESFYIVFDLNVNGSIDPDLRAVIALDAMKAAVVFWKPSEGKHIEASTFWHRYALIPRALRILTGAKKDSIKEHFH